MIDERMTPEDLKKNIEQIFLPNGIFSRYFKNYVYRPQQMQMALTIAKGIANQKAAIVEAGTGTGKSYGELIPSIIYAKKTDRKVLIVTHTIALQQQLALKDIPTVRNILSDLGITFKCVMLKGKNNFVCVKKLQSVMSIQNFKYEEDKVRFLKNAVKDGNLIVGDKDKLQEKPSDEFWMTISCGQDDSCDNCPFKKGSCFYYHTKEQAKEADVIISNHYMLMSDLAARKKNGYKPNSGLLPDYDLLVIDEAHHIEDVAADFLGFKIENSTVQKAIRNIDYFLRIADIKQEWKTEVEKHKNYFQKEMDSIFKDIIKTLEDEKKFSIFWDKPLNGDIESIEKLMNFLFQVQIRVQNNDHKSLVTTIVNQLNALLTDMRFINKLQDLDKFVYWASKEGHGAVVKATPLPINDYLKEGLFSRMPVVITSATIKFDKDLSFFANRIGKLKEDEYESMFVNAPFNYKDNVCLYVPENALEPEEEGYDEYCKEEMLEMIKKSKGRAFLLFTSNATMKKYYQDMEEEIIKMGYLPLMQGQYERNRMCTMFKEHGNAVLFGADSFWEGIDIPGRELSLVVIQKIPFATPNPVSKAKEAETKKNGGDAFLEGLVFGAVTKYKQGFGRLIRQEGDRGVFAVLDGRILSKKDRYGKYFLMATPDCKKTVNRDHLDEYFNY